MNSFMSLLTPELAVNINIGFLIAIIYLFVRVSELYGGSIGIKRSIRNSDPEQLKIIIQLEKNRISKLEKLISLLGPSSTSVGFLELVPEITSRLSGQPNESETAVLAAMGLITMILPSLGANILLAYIASPSYRLQDAEIHLGMKINGMYVENKTLKASLQNAIGHLKRGLITLNILTRVPLRSDPK